MGRKRECNTDIFSRSIDAWVNAQLICFMIAGWVLWDEICMRVIHTALCLKILFIIRPEEVCQISLCVSAYACVCVCDSYLLCRPLGSSRSGKQAQRGVGFIPRYTHKHNTKHAYMGTVSMWLLPLQNYKSSHKQTENTCSFKTHVPYQDTGKVLFPIYTALNAITYTHKQTQRAEQ